MPTHAIVTETTSSVAPCTNELGSGSVTPRNTGSSQSVRNSKLVNGRLMKPMTAASTASSTDGTTIVHGISWGSWVSRAGAGGPP